MKQDLAITSRVPEDDEDCLSIHHGTRKFEEGYREAVAFHHRDGEYWDADTDSMTPEGRKYWSNHYGADDGVYVISTAAAPWGTLEDGAEYHPSFRKALWLFWLGAYYTFWSAVRCFQLKPSRKLS